jgi:hypothetical protein
VRSAAAYMLRYRTAAAPFSGGSKAAPPHPSLRPPARLDRVIANGGAPNGEEGHGGGGGGSGGSGGGGGGRGGNAGGGGGGGGGRGGNAGGGGCGGGGRGGNAGGGGGGGGAPPPPPRALIERALELLTDKGELAKLQAAGEHSRRVSRRRG